MKIYPDKRNHMWYQGLDNVEEEKEEQDKKRKGSKLPRRKAKSREGEGGGDLCENQEDLATRWGWYVLVMRCDGPLSMTFNHLSWCGFGNLHALCCSRSVAHVGSCIEGSGGVQLKFCSSSPQISNLGYLTKTQVIYSLFQHPRHTQLELLKTLLPASWMLLSGISHHCNNKWFIKLFS